MPPFGFEANGLSGLPKRRIWSVSSTWALFCSFVHSCLLHGGPCNLAHKLPTSGNQGNNICLPPSPPPPPKQQRRHQILHFCSENLRQVCGTQSALDLFVPPLNQTIGNRTAALHLDLCPALRAQQGLVVAGSSVGSQLPQAQHTVRVPAWQLSHQPHTTTL
jgi:hypothetical protein